MVKVGDMLYGMRVVESYNGHNHESKPLFNGFEGYVVWDTWDTGDLQVLKTWTENGKFITQELGIIDDNLISDEWNDKQVADFIKTEVTKMKSNEQDYYQVTLDATRKQFLKWDILSPTSKKASKRISFKVYNQLTEEITAYVNEQIDEAIKQTQDIIAIDEVVAQMIQNYEGRGCKS